MKKYEMTMRNSNGTTRFVGIFDTIGKALCFVDDVKFKCVSKNHWAGIRTTMYPLSGECEMVCYDIFAK